MNTEIDLEVAYLEQHRAIRLYDPKINSSTTQRIEQLLTHAKKSNIPNIKLEIACSGGDARQSLLIADHIARYPGEVIGIVETFAFSGAVTILQACHRRLVMQHGMLLLHSMKNGSIRGIDRATYRQQRAFALETNERFITLCVQRSGKSRQYMKRIFEFDAIITATQALRHGFIDTIINPPGKKRTRVKKPWLVKIGKINLHSICATFHEISKARAAGAPLHLEIDTTLEGPDGMMFLHLIAAMVSAYPFRVTTHIPGVIAEYELALFLLGEERSCSWISDVQFGPLEVPTTIRELSHDDISEITFKALSDMEQLRAKLIRSRSQGFDLKTLSQYSRITTKQALQLGIVTKIEVPRHFTRK